MLALGEGGEALPLALPDMSWRFSGGAGAIVVVAAAVGIPVLAGVSSGFGAPGAKEIVVNVRRSEVEA